MEARWAKLSSSETSAAQICPGDKPGRPQKHDAGTRSNPVRMCREETPAKGWAGAGPAYYGDKHHPPWRLAMNKKHAIQVQAESYLDQDGVEKLRIAARSRSLRTSTSGMAPIIDTSKSGEAMEAYIYFVKMRPKAVGR